MNVARKYLKSSLSEKEVRMAEKFFGNHLDSLEGYPVYRLEIIRRRLAAYQSNLPKGCPYICYLIWAATIAKRIAKKKEGRPILPRHIVTDHALVKFMERELKIDVRSLKDRVLRHANSNTFPVKREGLIVTFLKNGWVET